MTFVSFVVSFLTSDETDSTDFGFFRSLAYPTSVKSVKSDVKQKTLLRNVSFNIGWNGFHGFWLHFRTCLGINFCSLCPKSMNSYNFLIIIDIMCDISIKSPKIHPKSLLLYIFFANFLFYPFSKLPDPNDVVSSINAYGVNSWHLIGYEGWDKATDERKNAIKCLISAIYYIFLFFALV